MVKKSQKLFGESSGGGKLVIYTDGGARGNPGPAALGVVVAAPEGRASSLFGRGDKEYSEYLGEMTNNKAEYLALVFALKKVY